MSEIVVRPYEPKDQEQTWHVRAMTYNSGQPIPVEKQVYKTATPYVGEVDGRIVGTFVVMDMTCTRGRDAAWKTGGIAGVAVLPEARQTGVGNAMMRWALRHLRDNGYILAALYPFRESYYRKFGYEVCGLRYKITCPTTRLPRHKSKLPLRSIPNDQYGDLKPCYDAFARARSGMNLREDFHWGRMLGEKKTIYAAGDPVEAYAVLEHDWQFWEEQPIVEFAWTSVRGYESILSLFGSVGINKTSLTWYEPSDGLMLARHCEQGVRFESEKPIMFRVLNFPAALESLSVPGTGEFSVGVHDPEIPENDGPWQVCYAHGKSQVLRADSTELRFEPQSMAQALIGQPSLDDLTRNGLVADVEAARRFLSPLPTYCMDFF